MICRRASTDTPSTASNPASTSRPVWELAGTMALTIGVGVAVGSDPPHLLATAETHTIRRGGTVVYPYRAHVPFLLLLARTGLRLGAAVALQWGDVNFRGGFLEVRRAWVKGRITTPKSGRTRRVDMSAQLKGTLQELYRERFEGVVAMNAEAEAARRVADRSDAWVFSEGKRPLDPDNFRRRVFEPLLQDAEMRKIRIYDIRHTYASLLLQAGKELLYVSEQIGHHNPRFTLGIYGHLLPRDRRGEVNVLDDPPATIRNLSATTPFDVDAEKEEAPQPIEVARLLRAGDRGRTGDLMLGKHTL